MYLAMVFSCLIAFLSSCSRSEDKTEPISIVFDVFPGYAHVFIAQEKGFFKKNGVDVNLILKQDYTSVFETLREMKESGAFAVYPDVLMHNAKGGRQSLVYVCDYSLTSDVIVGRPEFQTLADLRDKVVAFEGINSFSQIFVITALEKYGLPEYSVRFANLRNSQMLEALETHTIDAAHTWEPYTSRILQKGYKVLATAEEIPPGIIADTLIFSHSLIQKRPKAIKAIVQSLFEALTFEKQHPEEALQIMAKKTGLSPEEIRKGRQGIFHPNLAENIALLTEKTTSSLYSSGEIILDFYLKRGQLSQRSSKIIDSTLNPTFVQELEKDKAL